MIIIISTMVLLVGITLFLFGYLEADERYFSPAFALVLFSTVIGFGLFGMVFPINSQIYVLDRNAGEWGYVVNGRTAEIWFPADLQTRDKSNIDHYAITREKYISELDSARYLTVIRDYNSYGHGCFTSYYTGKGIK